MKRSGTSEPAGQVARGREAIDEIAEKAASFSPFLNGSPPIPGRKCDPPCFLFVFHSRQSVRSPGRLDCSSRRGWSLAPTVPGNSWKFDSGDFLQASSEAVSDWLGGLDREFLNEVPKFLVLRGSRVEVLTALRG
jgi:hypothetical protein